MLPNLKSPSARFAIALSVALLIPISIFAAIDAAYFTASDFEPGPSSGSPSTTGGSGTRLIPHDRPPVSNPNARR